jgi:3-polyprenyl-4-hydroxybenzoate decarboxylase
MATPRFPYPDLKDYLAALQRAGELHRVPVQVDPTLEMSEIVTAPCARVARRCCSKSPAVVACRS